jgi:hypothetical protein
MPDWAAPEQEASYASMACLTIFLALFPRPAIRQSGDNQSDYGLLRKMGVLDFGIKNRASR